MSITRPKLGLIAGGGDLPEAIARGAIEQGRDLYILGVLGFAAPDILEGRDGRMISIGETGAQIKSLKSAGVEELCFAGIVTRPDFKNIKLDARGVSILPKVLSAARKGDDALLRAILSVFEKEGFAIVGADEVLNSLTVASGALTQLQPNETDLADLKVAARVALEMGRMDIGQGAVCCNGLVLAVEAAEGTDQMLKRCGELPENIRGTSDKRAGVLVKRPKPNQERRIDLPTIGVATVERAAAAGLAGIAVEAEGALVLEQEKLIQTADRLGVWVYVFRPDEVA